VLDKARAEVVRERSARKEPFGDDDARALLRGVQRLIVARGRRVVELDPTRARPADLKGPTGNYRAPMVLRGRTLLVGFNDAALRELLG